MKLRLTGLRQNDFAKIFERIGLNVFYFMPADFLS